MKLFEVYNTDIRYLKGVGEKRAELYHKLGVFDIADLLGYYPRAYIDLNAPDSLISVPFGEPRAVRVTVGKKSPGVRVAGGRTVYKVSVFDDTADAVLTFFNNRFTPESLTVGREYVVYGRFFGRMGSRETVNPMIVSDLERGVLPVYPLTAGMTSRSIESAVRAALARVTDTLWDPLPEEMIKKYGLARRFYALEKIHFPKNIAETEAARRRLIFEELLVLQLGMARLKNRERRNSSAVMEKTDAGEFLSSLPFEPTGAQLRVIKELTDGFGGEHPVSRLLQGDVGSGKTLVAAAGAWCAAQNGFQSVIMAPTEILARQHADTFSRLMPDISIVLLTGSVKGKKREKMLAEIKNGDVKIIIGTHAVISSDVEYSRLGFVVADEQHRFGVAQRARLAAKGESPHILVMSATPIPRTLALIVYADLDVSVLDEMPKGRKPVKTYAVGTKKRADMYGFIDKQIAEGRQAYIVCPAIEDNELDITAASEYYERVLNGYLKGRRVALLHGKMKSKDKLSVISDFAAGEIDALVTTTVIEVGIDVKNATVMVVEDADRFGLSALHQLRGRVGRGAQESYCILVSDTKSESAAARLKTLCTTSDGFELARADLEQRGPGDFFGNRQHGLPKLAIADLMSDSRLLYESQQAAREIAERDAALEYEEHAALLEMVKRLFRDNDTAFN